MRDETLGVGHRHQHVLRRVVKLLLSDREIHAHIELSKLHNPLGLISAKVDIPHLGDIDSIRLET